MNKDELYFLILGSIFGCFICTNLIRCYFYKSNTIEPLDKPGPEKGRNAQFFDSTANLV